MNEHEFKRRFPRASQSTIKRNCDRFDAPGSSDQSQSLDRQFMEDSCGNEAVQDAYKLCHIEVVFYAAHGNELDKDNKNYVVKKIQDSLVELGFSRSDKDITSKVDQRMDENQTDF